MLQKALLLEHKQLETGVVKQNSVNKTEVLKLNQETSANEQGK